MLYPDIESNNLYACIHAVNPFGLVLPNNCANYAGSVLFVAGGSMNLRYSLLALGALMATSAFGQAIAGSPPDAFMVRYASNLNVGDSVINITNAGTANTAAGALT